MIRNFFRHLREATQSIGRNFGRSMLSIVTVGFTLLLVGIFTSVLLNVKDLANDATSTLEVKVFVDTAATPEDQDKLKKQLESIPNVTQVTYSSKDEQLNRIVEKWPVFNIFENDSNPLYDAYILKVDNSINISRVAQDARTLKYVIRANDGGSTTDSLVAFSKSLEIWGTVLIVILVVIAIILIMNVIRTTILSRQTEIEIMRLVGATKWFIRGPFLIEGALIGFLGSLPASIIIYIGYMTLYSIIEGNIVGLDQYSLLPADPYAVYMAVGLSVIGILVGALGSVISIRRFLKK
ncbi:MULTISPECIES: permease-like cell division protein FtsX [unclassified Granulicatella]|uniref:permease-like cell division protein FtsX n=1 Tax=unclassified Granulicatella TaxID=2630493 RepID=UPI0014307CD4|nr:MULTISPECIES: permease-like cell division protein FtsX [unclassified Granulicatella]MBF0780408.1 ABC transporter permease [Granulicatella sp. 19428wC4_WM01]